VDHWLPAGRPVATLARMPKHPEAELQAVRDSVRASAVPRGRVFRRQDLIEWGLPADLVVPMLRRRWWVRLHHGVYADCRDVDVPSDGPAAHLLHLAASIRALTGPAFAFGPSAALLHGLALPHGLPRDVHLVRPLGSEGRSLTRRVTAADHLPAGPVRTCALAADDVTAIDGIPTVGPALAAVSASVDCTHDWAVAVMDSAAWRAPERIDEMHRHAGRLQHLAGIGVARAAIAHVRTGAQTPLESHSRLQLVRCGLPEPRLQVPFDDAAGPIGIVDMYFDDLGVIGEADGLLKYTTPADLIREKQREDRLRRLRPVVRWDWSTIWNSPESVAAQIRDAARWRRAG
jgi:hypothetical protein